MPLEIYVSICMIPSQESNLLEGRYGSRHFSLYTLLLSGTIRAISASKTAGKDDFVM